MAKPEVIYLKNYQVSPFLIDKAQFYFELEEEQTLVIGVLHMRRNPASAAQPPLRLDGEKLKLLTVVLDGHPLNSDQYHQDEESLTIYEVPDAFTLETQVHINPKNNTALNGLYLSNGNYCTQCEPHGFRCISYYLDRPDVMSYFTVAISADKERYPYLLSNGNLIEQKELANGRHWALWEDPSLKSSYLFALVAGDFEYLEDIFTTMSGREVLLRLYLEKGNLDQGEFALQSLVRAMRWDEQCYGREYDLDRYMIVAVGDFNMGAMENKGLNVFNTKYILANPNTATDLDYLAIENVVGHEYFHNWTGNRVTCRDWFQITLKEGLTVFRDQCFSADMNSALLNRINAVNIIRNVQFPQDAGPMAHPIRPDHYIEINNFYTVTVYNKGAEVIRMVHTLLGADKFRQGTDLYFKRFDGKAVTTEDFIKAMEDASGVDLTQFRKWYQQSGTPQLDLSSHYDAEKREFNLKVKQHCPPTADQKHKENLHIPLSMALLDEQGKEVPLQLSTESAPGATHRVLNITDSEHVFIFVNINDKVIPSLLRNFSAPVILNYPYTSAELIWLMKHETDAFNRWDASQRVATNLLLTQIKNYQKKQPLVADPHWLAALEHLLENDSHDWQLVEKCLTLPTEAYLLQQMKPADIEAIHQVREWLKKTMAEHLQSALAKRYRQLQQTQPYEYNVQAMGMRSLKNLCLYYLQILADQSFQTQALAQLHQADNMTDKMGALQALNDHQSDAREMALAEFYQAWQHEPLVVDKWLSLQAAANLPDTLQRVKALVDHPAFDIRNPNKVRSLIGVFANNLFYFHALDGSGYIFLAEQVLAIDPANPQLAARILEPLSRWQCLDHERQQLMKHQLQRIMQTKDLSKDVYEVTAKSLAV